MGKIIERDRSIIPACDVDLEKFEDIVRETANIDGVGAYKIGFVLSLNYGLPKVVETARKYTNKPLIYDHQKGGTDIPDVGVKYAEALSNAGIDAAILFPMAGNITQREWTEALQKKGIEPIIGGLMTHAGYLYEDLNVVDSGFIAENRWLWMYRNGIRGSVNNYVVPGNKPDKIKEIKEELVRYQNEIMKPLDEKIVFYAPGFVAQGGEITEAAKVAGDSWHAIVGRAIYKADNIAKAAEELTSKL